MEEGKCVHQRIIIREGIRYIFLFSERSYVNIVTFRNQNSCLIIVSATIIRCRENSYDRWKFFSAVPLMKFVTPLLAFMSSNNSFESLFFKQIVHWSFAKNNRDLSFIIILKINISCLVALWVSP